MKRLWTFALALAGLAAIPAAHATEGAMGHAITGMQATSYAGLIPPTPGWQWGVGYIYDSGSIGASREVPLTGGGTSLGLNAQFQLLAGTGIYIWNTQPSSWNFASMVEVPMANVGAQVEARVGPYSRRVTDSATGPFDITFAPVIASHHFNETQHLSLSMYVSAPTGSYDKGNLANVSLNNWTFSPTVGYTQLFQQGSLEWSTTAAVDIYTKNHATDYQNGPVFRVDSIVMKRLPSGWGFGAVGGWIQQISNDTGPTADALGGFKGHALGVGPAVNYLKKWKGGQAEVSLRWLHEFDVKNRLAGNPAMMSVSISL